MLQEILYDHQYSVKNAINRVVKSLNEDPKKSKVSFRASAELKKGLRSDISIRGFKLAADEPDSLGGTDSAPNPVELVLAAFASCQEIVIATYAASLRIPIDKIEVEVEGGLDLRGFFNVDEHIRPGFENIRFNTKIFTPEKDPNILKKLEFFAQNRCPVLDILEHSVPVNGQFSIIN